MAFHFRDLKRVEGLIAMFDDRKTIDQRIDEMNQGIISCQSKNFLTLGNSH